MLDVKCQVEKFLKEYGMDAGSINTKEILGAFESEMSLGLSGKGSSLAMLPSYIGVETVVPANKPVIVLDAGGTNLRVCTVTFDEHGNDSIENFEKFQMPGIAKELTAKEFYENICDYLEPVINKSDSIGFCFSYPSEISPEKDGKLITWTKEVKVPEVVGHYIATGLKDALEERGYKDKKIVLLNDTVSCLLAGKAIGEQRHCGGYLGFILGTGTNIAYVESNSNISGMKDSSGSQVINVESGNFNKIPGSIIDNRYDESTENPGKQRCEKMISGRYLGEVSLLTIKQAASDGLFSDVTKKIIDSMINLETSDISFFLDNPFNETSPFKSLDINDRDREVLYLIIQGIIERAAKLTAINISSGVIKADVGHSPLHPVCINVDGSTFHKLYGFRERAESYLRDILTPKNLYVKIYEVENAPIIGSAIAGLVG